MASADIDYERCNLCRRSFQKGKNHIYSAKHIQVVRQILTKFSIKVQYSCCMQFASLHNLQNALRDLASVSLGFETGLGSD